MKQPIARNPNRQRGQALVEYIMAVILCIGVASMINGSIKKGIAKIWVSMAADIAPGCPGCTPPEQIK